MPLLGWALCLVAVSLCHGHVRLSFPPSSSLSDALVDDVLSPCGPPSNRDELWTYLEAGSTVEVEWTSAIPHDGGIRIELLDESLSPVSSFVDFSHPHNISDWGRTLRLPPALLCDHCTLRLSHAAREISPNTRYISCAHVHVVKTIPDGDTCSGHGHRVGGVCLCEDEYKGSHCQHHWECEGDVDCGGEGRCRSPAPHTKTCFCPNGTHGKRCHQAYPSTVDAFDESLYKMKNAGDNKIYWRIVKDEIEMVLKYPGSGWAAVGWKEKGKTSCPLATPSSTSSPSIPSTSRPSTTRPSPSTSRSPPRTSTPSLPPLQDNDLLSSSPSSSSKGGCGSNEEWSECPEESRECEPSCQWTLSPDSIPSCSSSCGSPRCVCSQTFVRVSANSSECIPFDDCNSSEAEECVAGETWAQCGAACEPSCANMYDSSPCMQTCEKAACTCADNYVRHEGKCIYWGDCPDLDHAFEDNALNDTRVSWSGVVGGSPPPSSSPLPPPPPPPPPTSCPANETISECGSACETDCVSVFVRDQCTKCGPPDCTCIQGYARSNGHCVYWGECPQEDISLEKRPPMVMGTACNGEWASPFGCTTNCQYRVMWNYLEKTDEVEFAVEAKMKGDGWTGFGLASSPSMTNADMYVVKSVGGRVSVHDMWSTGRGVPVEDSSRDIAVPSPLGSHVDGKITARFKRRRISKDTKTDHDLSNCLYMLFPVNGGPLAKNGDILIHSSTPAVSDRHVCFRSCNPKKETPPPTDDKCQSEFRHPSGCTPSTCEYTARWEFNSSSRSVFFSISARDLGRWTGIGFSADGQMSNADIYTGWVYEGKALVTDRFAYGRQIPVIDPVDRHDITDIGGKVEDDVQTIWFRRPLVTSDGLSDLPLDECLFFLFPVGGGRVLARKSSDLSNPRTPIGFHDLQTPLVSPHKICICQDGSPVPHEPVAVRRRRQAAPFALPSNPFDHTQENDPMACADMVVGWADGENARVVDMFSIGKGTPIDDETAGGKDSLTAAHAAFHDGVTTVSFRKKLLASDSTDNSIVHGPMQLLWAKGVDPLVYRHVTGGAPIKAESSFFSPHSLKYHGMDNRGVLTVDFYGDGDKAEASGEGSHCRGSMAFPIGCRDCSYSVSWTSDGATATFQLEADLSVQQWTAIGFSDTGAMANSDVIVVSVLEEGKVAVMDEWMPSYSRPSIDRDQDIFDVSASYSNGRVFANFSRDLKGVDGHDLSLDKCRYFLYTPSPSPVEKGGELAKHSSTPLASTGKVCLASCTTLPATAKPTKKQKTPSTPAPTPKTTKTTTTTSSPPPRVPPPHPPLPSPTAAYTLKIRILNRQFVPDLANPKSEYYQQFSKDLKTAVDKALAVKWADVEMGKVLSYTAGSVVAVVEVNAHGSRPKAIEIQSVVEETAMRGHLNGLALEATTVMVEDWRTEERKTEVEEGRWVMGVAAVAGSTVVVIFALCIVCYVCCRIRRVSHRFSPMGSANGKSYSDIPYKADYGAYPSGGPPPMGTLNAKPGGFENKAYQHQRHFSQATTASTKQSPAPSTEPSGMGETTYQEWLARVASAPSSQQHEESVSAPRPPSNPYVSYPNDPAAYYTLGGEHRSSSKHPRPPF